MSVITQTAATTVLVMKATPLPTTFSVKVGPPISKSFPSVVKDSQSPGIAAAANVVYYIDSIGPVTQRCH